MRVSVITEELEASYFFIRRIDELAQITALLRDLACRLPTLLNPPPGLKARFTPL